MTPANGTRVSDDMWRQQLEEKMDGQHARVGNRQDRTEQRLEDMRNVYVTKESLNDKLKNLTDDICDLKKILERYENGFQWFERIVVGSFLAALARIVYISAK